MADLVVGPSEVLVPISLPQTTELFTSDKLVWLALELNEGMSGGPSLSQRELAASLGLCRQTVAKATRRLAALGWRAPRAPGAPRQQGAPGAAGTPGASAAAGTPDAPGRSGAPGIPGTPATLGAASPLSKLAGGAVEVAVRLLQEVSVPAAARLLHMQVQAAQVRTPTVTMKTKYAVLAEGLQRGVKAVRRPQSIWSRPSGYRSKRQIA